MTLKNKRVLLGVTGGIAAYKSAEVTSRLRKMGADVHVAMTKSAIEFVSPLTFRTVSANPVFTDMFSEPKVWNVEHISLAEWPDVVLVAPATANFVAKMALGLADDFLSTVLLAVRAQIFVAPAMNHAMYHHPATRKNLRILQDRGISVIGPDRGFQACGTEGDGRMSEPEQIVNELEAFFSQGRIMAGKKVLVTAGGTREPLDPVRYIGNFSSGKMGYAVAQAFAEAGAEVTLVSAPSNIEVPHGVKLISVVTAVEMYKEVLARFPEQDIVVKAAAVADYRPQSQEVHKMKKKEQSLNLELVPNPDILSKLGESKQNQLVVGFAAETRDHLENGLEKLKRKKADILVVNDVTLPEAGFGTDTNIVSFLFSDGRRRDLPVMSKLAVSRELVKEIAGWRNGSD